MPSVERALCDTGPLVAMADRDDISHKRCRSAFESFGGDLLTTWPVLTEAFYLLEHPGEREFLWGFIMTGGIEIIDIAFGELVQMRALMNKYHDLPMDFADASLVVVAERLRLRKVFTLDRRGFGVYRPRRIRSFEVFP